MKYSCFLCSRKLGTFVIYAQIGCWDFVIQTFIIHKPTRFLKSRHYVIIFLNNVIVEEMTRRFYCVIDVNLWLKLVTIPLIELQLCKNMFSEDLPRKNVYLKKSWPSVLVYILNLGQDTTPKTCLNLPNKWTIKLKKFQSYSVKLKFN